MNLKRGSIFFLLFLFIILVFIVGVRYGQRVEKTNKIINYLISLPPTQTPQPTQKPVEFQTYSNKSCGIQFLYPNFLTKIQEASTGARFTEGNDTTLTVECDKKSVMKSILEDQTIATQEVTFKNKKITVKAEAVGGKEILVFNYINPKNNKMIFIYVDKSLYPLFEKSLEFTP